MADNAAPSMDYEEHTKTYARFVQCSIGLTAACLFILVALIGFGVGSGVGSILVATIGMLVGFGTAVYGAASEQNSWIPALVVLVLMGLATVVFL